MSKPKKVVRKFKLHDEGYDYSYHEKQKKEKRKIRREKLMFQENY